MRRGFTLIELLVVMSIVSTLSSVILASLSQARVKGKNSAIQSAVIQLRSQFELGRDSSSKYTNIWVNDHGSAIYTDLDTNSKRIIDSIIAQNPGTQYSGGITPIYLTNCGATPLPVYNIDVGGGLANPTVDSIAVRTDTSCSGSPANPTAYSIWAAYGPAIGSSGYFCVDSGGKTTTGSGAIPAPTTTPSPGGYYTCQ